MRSNYWELGRVGQAIRKVCGMDPTPHAETMEGWGRFNKRDQMYHPFGLFLLNCVATAQKIWMFIPDMIDSVRYFIKNVRCQSHVLSTTHGKFGQWSDLTSRIPDAMFTAVVDFVEVECAHRETMSHELSDGIFDTLTPDPTPAEQGINYLRRYEEMQKEEPEQDYSPWIKSANNIIEIYEFAKIYLAFDEFKEAKNQLGYDYDDTGMFEMTDKKRAYFDLVNKLETEMEEKKLHFMKMICDEHRSMWT